MHGCVCVNANYSCGGGGLCVGAVPSAAADSLRSVDPSAEACSPGDTPIVYSFQIETQTEIETNDTTLKNETHITVNSSVTAVTLNGCKLSAPAANSDQTALLTSPEIMTIRNLLTADEASKLIAFAESKGFFAGSDPQAISSGYLNESHLAEFGESIEPIEDRIAGWLNTSVDHLEYFQFVKLTPGAAPYQYSPSFDIDYSNHRPKRAPSAEDLLIADAVQHHRIAAVFIYLSDAVSGSGSGGAGFSNVSAFGVRVQPRVGAALYYPIAPSDEDESDNTTTTKPRSPLFHFSEAIPASASGAQYGLNVWVYPQTWRGDGEDDDELDFDDDDRIGLDGSVLESDELDQYFEAGGDDLDDDSEGEAVADSAEEDAILESFLAAAGAEDDSDAGSDSAPAGEDDVDLPDEGEIPADFEAGEEGEDGGDDGEEENPFLAIMEKEKAEGKIPPAAAPPAAAKPQAPPTHTEL